MMEERNCDKEMAKITLQDPFNEKEKKSKGKWPMKSKGSFQNFGGKESQNSKYSTCQKGNSNYDKNDGQGNFIGDRKRIDKSNMQCFICQRFSHFAREWNANKKEPQWDEAKVARQEFDKENSFLVMITERECSNSRLRDNINNGFGNAAKACCNRLHKSYNRLQAEENVMMSMKGAIQCYLFPLRFDLGVFSSDFLNKRVVDYRVYSTAYSR